MTKKERVSQILQLLDEFYPNQDKCFLFYEKPHELLIATILSAQCTDDRVNQVTPGLFKKYPEIETFAKADVNELGKDIHSTGFYNSKSKNIIAAAARITEVYGGEVPDNLDALLTLPGVGRKTANVVLGHIWNIPGVIVDTHVKRISRRLGFTENENPEKIEYDLMKLLPKTHWLRFNTQIITLGRNICKARKPDCKGCFICGLCPSKED